MSYTCQTAPNTTFTSRDELHAHYKSEWHRYNLKRKVSSLPPVSSEEFETRKAAALALSAEQRRKAGAGTGTGHLKQNKSGTAAKVESKKNLKALKLAKAKGLVPATAQLAKNKPVEEGSLPTPPPKSDTDDIVLSSDMGESSSEITKREPGQWQEVAWTDEGEEIQKFIVNVKTCIFSKHKSETVAGNIRYMQENYGLFIPDVEYLVDPEGLIAYLAHKVINGKTCLWTGRQFRTSQSCIQSMIDSSNCRIKYETEDDFAEYADFYDFTTSYPEGEEDARVDGEAEGAAAAAVGRVDEGDGWVSDEDDAEGEQIPTGELRSGGWTKVKVDDAAEDGNAGAHKKRTITVNEQGELLLLDGRIVGHRKFKRFYKQRYSDLDTSVQMVTINGVSQPLPSKIRAVVRRFPQHKQSQLLLGYQEGGYDALAMVKKPREAGGLVSLPRQEQRRYARNQQQKMMKLGIKGGGSKGGFLMKHFKFRDPFV